MLALKRMALLSKSDSTVSPTNFGEGKTLTLFYYLSIFMAILISWSFLVLQYKQFCPPALIMTSCPSVSQSHP